MISGSAKKILIISKDSLYLHELWRSAMSNDFVAGAEWTTTNQNVLSNFSHESQFVGAHKLNYVSVTCA